MITILFFLVGYGNSRFHRELLRVLFRLYSSSLTWRSIYLKWNNKNFYLTLKIKEIVNRTDGPIGTHPPRKKGNKIIIIFICLK